MNVHALILAGGKAARMGHQDKGLTHYHGMPLIDCVINRIEPQVSQFAICANRNLEEFARRSPHVFSDTRQWKGLGPLAAMSTAANDLQLTTADWILIVPCDMPKLPDNLVEAFLSVAKRTPVCSAFYAETPVQPHYGVMFIRPQILQSTVPYLASGMRTIRGWLHQQRSRPVLFADDKDFININTLQDLEQL